MTRAIKILLLLGLGIAGCGRPTEPRVILTKYSQSTELMATTATIDVCIVPSEEEKVKVAFEKVWERLRDIAWRMNVFDEKSDVAAVNNQPSYAVAVGADTYFVVQKAVEYNRLTEGTFDITVWPLIKLWREAQKNNDFPPSEKILAIKSQLGPSAIEFFADHRIRLNNDTAKIDLGGIAAGYAVDESARILREHGFQNFLIDLGGDMYAGGKNCLGQPWRIGIKDPRDTSQLLDVVYLTDAGITTSGDYEKFYVIHGQRWSHIFNPVTGYPQKGVTASTLIAPTTIEADAFATAVTVLGALRGRAFVDSLGTGYGVIIVDSPDGVNIRRTESEGYKSFKRFQ